MEWKRSACTVSSQSSSLAKPESRGQGRQGVDRTLRASLSGTFLQTLPELVTPLKGHSLSPRSCPPTRSAPSETFRYRYDCGSSLAPKHPRKHETHPPRVTKRVPDRFRRLWFYFCWCKLTLSVAINARLALFELFVTNLLLFEHHQQQQNCSLADSFQEPMSNDITKYGSG